MSLIVDIVNAVTQFRQDVDDMRSTGIYQFFTQWFAEFVKWSMVGWFKFKLQSITFAYDVAQEILSSLKLSDVLQSSFSSLDSRLVSIISFFRIPEALNIVFSAYTTRFVLNFMGL